MIMRATNSVLEENQDQQPSEADALLRAAARYVDYAALSAHIEARISAPLAAADIAPRYSTTVLIKVLLLQQIYDLADDVLCAHIQERQSFREFLGLGSDCTVPGASAIWQFRDRLIHGGLGGELFETAQRQLLDHGLVVRCGKIEPPLLLPAPEQKKRSTADGPAPPELNRSSLPSGGQFEQQQAGMLVDVAPVVGGDDEARQCLALQSGSKSIGMLRRAIETSFYDEASTVRRSRSGLSAESDHMGSALDEPLIALPNRFWLMNYLLTAIEHATRSATMFALLYIDLDDFKNIRYTMDEVSGDELLQSVASRLKLVLRPRDHLVRLGYSEFVLILDRIDQSDDATCVAERIGSALLEPFVLPGDQRQVVPASIGISLFPQDGGDGETLLKHADIAMFAAKARGRGHCRTYQPYLSEHLVAKLTTERELRDGIERDQFLLCYQPYVDAGTGEMRGLEALVRWRHPSRGLVSPLEFIPIAEETGLIVQLGELVLKMVCRQLASWAAEGLPPAQVSINVSPRQLSHGDLSRQVEFHTRHHGIDPARLDIEITESCMIEQDPVVKHQLASLTALGLKLFVDDFGTGYSSLSQLQQFDMDVLKIDRAFTAQLTEGAEGEALVVAIVSMAHIFGMRVIAEGVETAEQLAMLQKLACDEVQGYLISRPVHACDVPALLLRRFLFAPPN